MLSIEVHVVRNGHFYFYSRWRNGMQDVFAEKITRERAQQIVEGSDEASEVSSRGEVSFAADGADFSFIAKWVIGGEGA
ncbi:MAG: hypothetical protein KC421_30510 [Anaerolineales bacterium]|nr:hypothetical protein [Anaerolineales bacterium]